MLIRLSSFFKKNPADDAYKGRVPSVARPMNACVALINRTEIADAITSRAVAMLERSNPARSLLVIVPGTKEDRLEVIGSRLENFDLVDRSAPAFALIDADTSPASASSGGSSAESLVKTIVDNISADIAEQQGGGYRVFLCQAGIEPSDAKTWESAFPLLRDGLGQIELQPGQLLVFLLRFESLDDAQVQQCQLARVAAAIAAQYGPAGPVTGPSLSSVGAAKCEVLCVERAGPIRPADIHIWASKVARRYDRKELDLDLRQAIKFVPNAMPFGRVYDEIFDFVRVVVPAGSGGMR